MLAQDLMRFGVIYFIFLMGFGQAYYIIFMSYDPADENPMDTWMESILQVFAGIKVIRPFEKKKHIW